MKSKTILGADGTTKMRQITVGIHGKGGETGIKAVMLLTALINDLKQWKADFVGTEESAAAKTWFTAVPEKAAAMESV